MNRDIAACSGAYSKDNQCPLRQRCYRAHVGNVASLDEDINQFWVETKFAGNKCIFFIDIDSNNP